MAAAAPDAAGLALRRPMRFGWALIDKLKTYMGDGWQFDAPSI